MILGLAIAFAFAACEKAEITPADVQNTSEDKVVFENTTEEEAAELNAVLQGESFSEVEVGQKGTQSSTAPPTCCDIFSLTYNPFGSTPNLNVQLDVDNAGQQLVIRHWRKNGSTYQYVGQTTLSGFSACNPIGVNVGDPIFAPSGDYISWARIADGSSFCGNSGFLQWSH